MIKRIVAAMRFFMVGILLSLQGSSLFPAAFRPSYLRLVGVKVGRKCYIHRGVRFNGTSISMGQYGAIGVGAYLDGTGPLLIGDRVHVGVGVIILTGTHSIMPSVYRRDRHELLRRTVSIAKGCWFGSGSIILPGVSIGEGCVIGAGSVVVRDCEANGLYVGNPARRAKDLPVEHNSPVENGIPI